MADAVYRSQHSLRQCRTLTLTAAFGDFRMVVQSIADVVLSDTELADGTAAT